LCLGHYCRWRSDDIRSYLDRSVYAGMGLDMTVNGDLFLHHLQEIDELICQYRDLADGKEEMELLVIAINGNAAIAELVARQGRALKFLAGEKVDPEVQFAEGVLLGIGGGA
jgi:hypothetical protein